jgi:RNA polymerase sigma factor (sigma-70 family)
LFGKKTYTQEEILAGCVDNQRRFQEMLYRQHFSPMYAMCRRHVSQEDELLSILNAGFLKVFQKIHTFENRGSLQGWIRRIVYHTLIEHVRGQRRYRSHIVLDELPTGSYSGQVMDNLLLEDVMRLLTKVPNMSRKVFRLYAIEGFNHREIGEMLGINENTSKWHLSNARGILKTELEKNNMIKNATN